MFHEAISPLIKEASSVFFHFHWLRPPQRTRTDIFNNQSMLHESSSQTCKIQRAVAEQMIQNPKCKKKSELSSLRFLWRNNITYLQCCCKLCSSGTFKTLLQNHLKGSWRFLQFLRFLESRLQCDRYPNKEESVYWLWMCTAVRTLSDHWFVTSSITSRFPVLPSSAATLTFVTPPPPLQQALWLACWPRWRSCGGASTEARPERLCGAPLSPL